MMANKRFMGLGVLGVFVLLNFGLFLYGADSRNNPVTATYCDSTTVSFYAFSYVIRGDQSTYNCYDVHVTAISGGYRYAFEDGSDSDYNDMIVDVWATGNQTASPTAHVKYVSKDAEFRHWIFFAFNGGNTLMFKGEESSPGAVYDITLPARGCPDFSLNGSPNLRTIKQGESTFYTFTLSPTNGFSNPVSLSISGLPNGASYGFDINPLPVTGESKLTITTTDSVPVGTYTLTISGQSGNTTRTTSVTLEITEKPQPADYSLSASPAAQEITQGESTSYTASLGSINDFTSSVALSVTGLPSGAQGQFSVNPVSFSLPPSDQLSGKTIAIVGKESILTVTTSTNTPAGTYTLTITGEGGGQTHSVTVTLKVNQKPPDPDFSINASPTDREIIQGQSTSFTTSLTGLNNFNSSVALSVTGLPSGASGSFTVTPVTLTSSAESTLNILTTVTTPAGTYTLTITGEGGDKTHSTTVTLKINPKPADPDFTINVTPASREIIQGQSTSFTTSLTGLNNFNASVALSVTGLPSGASGSFTVTPVTLTSSAESTLNISTAVSTPAGTYTLTIKGEVGDKTHSTTVTLKINPKPADPDFTLTVTPPSQTLKAGSSTTFSVSINGLNGYSSKTQMSVSGLPSGTTGVFDINPCAVGGHSILTVKTSENTPVGTYTLTLTGKGEGTSLVRTKDVTLKIEPKPLDPDFEMNADPLTRTVSKKETALYSVSISPLNQFSGTVSLGISGIPAGTTAVFVSPTITGSGQTELRVVTTADTPAGTYSLTVTGESGSKKHSISLSLTVGCSDFTVQIRSSVSKGTAPLAVKFEGLVQTLGNTGGSGVNTASVTRPRIEGIAISKDGTKNGTGKLNAGKLNVLRNRTGSEFQYKWNFGDGGTSADLNPEHTFTNSGQYSVTLTVTDSCGTSKTASVVINVEGGLDVSILKQVDKTEAKPGDTLEYTITIKNNSSAALTGVKLTDELDLHLVFVSQGGPLSFSRQDNKLTWEGSLPAQQQMTVQLKARIAGEALSGSHIRNRASMTAAESSKGFQSNTVDTGIASDPIIPTRVGFSKHSEIPQIEVGRIIRFSIVIDNTSASQLFAPVIEDYLPQGFNYVAQSVLLNNQKFTEPSGSRMMTWQLPEIKPGERIELRYQVIIGADVSRGKNVNRAVLRTRDNSGQDIFLEASAYVDVSSGSFVFYSSVEGTVYLDRDGDDFYSMTDTPLPGIEVAMSTGQKTFTDFMGHYTFENLTPGEYLLSINRATLPEKYRVSFLVPKVVSLSDGLSDTVDFGVKFQGDDEVPTSRLEGRVFYDKNQNRSYDVTDALTKSFRVELDGKNETQGSDGKFVFTKLEPGKHSVEITYDGKTIKKELSLNKGNNLIDIPLLFTGIKITVRGEKND